MSTVLIKKSFFHHYSILPFTRNSQKNTKINSFLDGILISRSASERSTLWGAHSDLYAALVKISNNFIIIYAFQHKCCIMLPLVLDFFLVFLGNICSGQIFVSNPILVKNVFDSRFSDVVLIRELLIGNFSSCLQRKMSSTSVLELGEYKLCDFCSNSRLIKLISFL